MGVDANELLALPPAEQLRIVELLWDKLGEDSTAIPLLDWIDREGIRRRDELRADPTSGLDHATVWKRIDSRHG